MSRSKIDSMDFESPPRERRDSREISESWTDDDNEGECAGTKTSDAGGGELSLDDDPGTAKTADPTPLAGGRLGLSDWGEGISAPGLRRRRSSPPDGLVNLPSPRKKQLAAQHPARKKTWICKEEREVLGQLYRRTPLAPHHRLVRQSPLTLSGQDKRADLRGFVNLAVIVIIAMCGQLVLENLKRYGLMMNLKPSYSLKGMINRLPFHGTAVICLGLNHLILYVARLQWYGQISSKWALRLHVLLLNSIFWGPIIFVYVMKEAKMVYGLVTLLISCTMTMKMISFTHFTQYLVAVDKTVFASPEANRALPFLPLTDNACPLTLGRLWYFFGAPTLCFQIEYPRSPKIRWKFLVRRAMEVVFCGVAVTGIIQQYVTITITNSIPLLHQTPFPFVAILQRILKLAIPNLLCWLLFFYGFFHAYLNFWGELLRFGDRVFYLAWWNSKDLEEYWRLWNMPVHAWLLRHLYMPMRAKGLTRTSSLVVVFTFSAFMHEVLISVPFHRIQFYAFSAMFGQIPLVIISKWLVDSAGVRRVWGNWLFWLSFCIFGQPMGVLLYAWDQSAQ